MITFVRTRSIAPGKGAEAIAFAQQLSKMAKDKFSVQVNVNVPIGGNPDRLATVSSYASLAEFESIALKLVADADYLKMVADNAQNFLPGSIHDELWMSM